MADPQTTIQITAGNLPDGNFWEVDGSCWRYIPDAHSDRGYRMQPMNLKAFGKAAPEGPMTDFYQPARIKAALKDRL